MLQLIKSIFSTQADADLQVGKFFTSLWTNKSFPFHCVEYFWASYHFPEIGTRANSELLIAEHCSKVVCDELAFSGRLVNTCGPLKVCRNNMWIRFFILCLWTWHRTSFHLHQVHRDWFRPVTDRCGSSLMKSKGSSQASESDGVRMWCFWILWLSEPGWTS